MKKGDLKKYKLKDAPGVYFFLKRKEILYIGKATSLEDRVKSYFSKDLINTRGPMILDMVVQSTKIKYEETDSVLEALILESNLIKKYQPKYNTKEKDNKSFNYVCITNFTKKEVPKVLIVRGRGLDKKKYKIIYGPFPNGLQLREAMKIIRRIFPYVDEQSSKRNNKVFYEQLELTPESIDEYKNNIKNLKLFFEGKKKRIISNFKKEMMSFAKEKKFEKANDMKKRIFALEHINDVALIKDDLTVEHGVSERSYKYRIEGYDIAHMGGKDMVGVMVVLENGELNKKEYKKFIIRTQTSSNDTGALEEMLSRRFRHTEWGYPDLIVIDGGIAQMNVAKRVLDRYQLTIPIVSVVKDESHKAKALMGNDILIKKYKKDILLVNVESHRFAINFHKQKRNKSFI